MMKLSIEQLQEISAKTSLGMKAFVNKEIGKIFLILDPDSPHTSEEFLDDQLHEIYHVWNSYLEIGPISDEIEFEAMHDFVHQMENPITQKALKTALNSNSPFQNFMGILKSSKCLIEWEEFIPQKENEYVRDIFYHHGISISKSDYSDFVINY